MSNRIAVFVLVAALSAAGAYALLRPAGPPPTAEPQPMPHQQPPVGAMPPHGTTLPPNHPPIPGSASPGGAVRPSDDEPAALTWTAPARWQTAPNPSTMRLATYRVPRAAPDTDDAEVSVTRAGGTNEANIQRWLGQFDEAGQDTRETKKVRGLNVTLVEVSGTFLGGGMGMGASPAKHPGWSLLAAIVETPGSPYFFKMVGPTKTVRAARAELVAMIDGVVPK